MCLSFHLLTRIDLTIFLLILTSRLISIVISCDNPESSVVVLAVVLLNTSLRNRFWPEAMSCVSPLLCLIVVYLKSVPKGNLFLHGYLGISLCLSCRAKGIKQFWLRCCYALIRQLKRGIAMAQRIYFSCLCTHWGALFISLLSVLGKSL